jgi:two-component system, repressor protein LuxO
MLRDLEGAQMAGDAVLAGPRDGRRGIGRVARQRAREALAQGRREEALHWYERVRAAPIDGDAAQLALEEGEALMGLARYADLLALTSRAIGRRPRDKDQGTRLRIMRALALWELGRVAAARNEIKRAACAAVEPLTRARVEEARARLAWAEQRVEAARAYLASARAKYKEAGYRMGVLRTLEVEGTLLREAGRIREALELHATRIEMAAATPRSDVLARAHTDNGALLIVMGRWSEARAELSHAAELFRRVGDPREVTLAGCARAAADLGMGDLASARRGIERACEFNGREGGNPRALAHNLLLLADVQSAAGQMQAAEESCRQSLQLFGIVRDRGGACAARLRRSQAMLGQGRIGEALSEVRRVVAALPVEKIHVRAWAHLAEGRILLRRAPHAAETAFARARALARGRPGLADMATIGVLLARGCSPETSALRGAIARLEAWGDRQMLSMCLSDIRQMVGALPVSGQMEIERAAPAGSAAETAAMLVDAAVALAQGAGWIAAANALRRWLPWQRLIWLGDEGWEARAGEPGPSRLAPDDIARDLRARVTRPSIARLAADGPYRYHPTRVRHDLGCALLVPTDGGGGLYVDFSAGASVDEQQGLAVLIQFARLIEAHQAEPAPAPREAPNLTGIVGQSAAMREVLHWVKRVSVWRVPVHIFGETGTGKDLIARALHQESERGPGPFVAVNASSLSEELFESQMFGHVRGSFTGATSDSEGLAAHANKGTLFVDEVAELSARVQAKLLRFVQTGEYGRLGEATPRRADVRLLTATNVALQTRVAAGAFREDLMYRLVEWTITLPPLRERMDDVPLLARHFLAEFAEEQGRPPSRLSREAEQMLCECYWPGNVRQLRSATRQAAFRAEGRALRCEHFSEGLREARPAGNAGLRQARLSFEREHIAEVLERHRGNRTRTAAALGISRQGLYEKINRVGLA